MTEKKFQKIELRTPTDSMIYHPLDKLSDSGFPTHQRVIIEGVVKVVEAYRIAISELLSTKYRQLRNSLPDFLSKSGLLMVTCCSQGIIIRYDKREIDAVVGTWSEDKLSSLVAVLSENFVHCVSQGQALDLTKVGRELTIITTGPDGPPRDVAKIRAAVTAELPSVLASNRTNLPNRIVQTTDILELGLQGVEVEEAHAREGKWDKGRPFITRTPVPVGVKWNAFEIYSPYEPEQWNHKIAAQWAEQEILLWTTRQNMHRQRFLDIDPLFDARKYFVELIKSFDDVLENARKEEDLQKFLSDNPLLIEPTYKNMWSKLSLGTRDTDFVFELAIGDYLLVELEHPAKKLFRKNGVQSADLTQAIDQTVDWRRYIEDNLTTVQREQGLTGITSNPKSLIVIGRSSTLNARLRRKLATSTGQSPNLKILTYDDLRNQTVTIFENMVGTLHQQPGQTEVYYPKTSSIIWPVSPAGEAT
ncbi:MAG: Shedu anti-phage system protein SduA domain-containing protein [Nitrososphaerales archaeon]